ncbi:MAG TPA: hypothetical protein VGE93_06395 [Bryobacteraceae bacterium]
MASVIYRHDKKVDFISSCRTCRVTKMIEGIPADAYAAWRKGAKIQNVLPELSDGDREFLMSETCEECFDAAFPMPKSRQETIAPEVGQIWRGRTHAHQRVKVTYVNRDFQRVAWEDLHNGNNSTESIRTFRAYFKPEKETEDE